MTDAIRLSFKWLVIALGLVLAVACGICVLALVTYFSRRFEPLPPFAPETVVASPPPAPSISLSSLNWTLLPTGPALTDEFARDVLKLQPRQTEQVNTILQTIYKCALLLEARNTERHTDEAGHLEVMINPYPGSIAKLEDRLWFELDEILDVGQQSLARLNLRLDPPKLPSSRPVPNSDLAGPGFFGWGKDGAQIELWCVGSWHHWRVRSRGSEDSGNAPQLPESYRRFWQESVK